MKKVTFKENEVTDLINFYQLELITTKNKLKHIREVLRKLGAEKAAGKVTGTASLIDTGNVPRKRGRKPKAAPAGSARKAAAAKERKSKWGSFILEYLRKQDRLARFDEIVEAAFKQFKVQEKDKKNVEQAIVNSAFRLRKLHKKLNTTAVKGIKGKFVGVSEWFIKDGKPKADYAATLPESPRRAKRGRKKKPGRKPLPKPPKKRGRKSSVRAPRIEWADFIFDTISSSKKLYTSSQLAEMGLKHYNLTQYDKPRVKAAVASALSRQENITKKLRTFTKDGTRAAYYGLSDWFDGEKLKKEFQNKLVA